MGWSDIETGLVEPNFVKVYYEDLGKLSNLTGMQVKFLLTALKYIDYNNMISFSKTVKKEMMVGLGISDAMFRTTVSKLAKANIIKRVANGLYIANPDLLFKGKQGKRAKMIIQYNELGERESIKVEIEREGE